MPIFFSEKSSDLLISLSDSMGCDKPCNIAFANASWLFTSHKVPNAPSSRISLGPDLQFVETIFKPLDIASTITTPKQTNQPNQSKAMDHQPNQLKKYFFQVPYF